MCVEVVDAGSPFLQFNLIACRDGFFPVCHTFIEFLDGCCPGRLGKGREGLVVVAGEVRCLIPVKMLQLIAAPEENMIGQFADGVNGIGGFPSLLSPFFSRATPLAHFARAVAPLRVPEAPTFAHGDSAHLRAARLSDASDAS